MAGVSALAALDDWPVENAAGAVITAAGDITVHGDVDRRYQLASVTKLLVAEAVLVAVEEGAIDLDDPAGPPGSTVAHLLAHASGLAFATRDVEAPVGTARIYSSAGFEVVAETVEQAADIAFPDYLAGAVCEPLELTGTALEGPAGHGAVSTVRDLAAFAAELLAPTILSADLAARATTVNFPGLDGFVPGYGKHRPNDWGLGFEIRGRKSPHWTGTTNSPSTFGHFGQAGTFLWVDPELGAACVVLTDRRFGPWAKTLWAGFNDSVVAELATRR
ncbi:serine hydrolase domain-containing protein [Gordonia sp. NPDC003376]